jgi:hypothetical protein
VTLLARWEGEARVGAKRSGLRIKWDVVPVRSSRAQKETWRRKGAGKGE